MTIHSQLDFGGIETLHYQHNCQSVPTLNWTLVELKVFIKCGKLLFRYPLNWTLVELKLGGSNWISGSSNSLNWTLVELKPGRTIHGLLYVGLSIGLWWNWNLVGLSTACCTSASQLDLVELKLYRISVLHVPDAALNWTLVELKRSPAAGGRVSFVALNWTLWNWNYCAFRCKPS